jgi:hypothetical protein
MNAPHAKYRLRDWLTPPVLLPIFFGLLIFAVALHRHQF